MELEELRQYLKSKPGAYEDLPFGPDALVIKVMKKMFALVAWNDIPIHLSLKCDPEHAQALRMMFKSIIPGYHLNKEHWNTIILDKEISPELIYEMIDESYQLVISKLSVKERLELTQLSGDAHD